MDQYLGHYIRGMINHQEGHQDLLNFVVHSSELNPKPFETTFAPETARIFAYANNLELSRFYVLKALQGFVYSWGTEPQFAFEARHRLLTSLQVSLEVEEFIDFVSQPHSYATLTPLNDLLRRWGSRYPSRTHDDPVVWESLVHQRSFLLHELGEAFNRYWSERVPFPLPHAPFHPFPQATVRGPEQQNKAVLLKDVREAVLKERGSLIHNMAAAMRVQGNFTLVQSYVKMSSQLVDPGSASYIISVLKTYKSHADRSEPSPALDRYARTLLFIQEKVVRLLLVLPCRLT